MSVRPLALWVMRQQWTVRYGRRTPEEVEGILTTPTGPLPFRYEKAARRIHLPDKTVAIDAYGWEVDAQGRTVFRSRTPRATEQDGPKPM